MDALFQSTRPLRGATLTWATVQTSPVISIHAPLAGRDVFPALGVKFLLNFNPRAPCGARHKAICNIYSIPYISIHAPLAGRDRQLLPDKR